MNSENEKKSTKNGKKSDGEFHSKHIKHSPQAESARTIFGLNEDEHERKRKS